MAKNVSSYSSIRQEKPIIKYYIKVEKRKKSGKSAKCLDATEFIRNFAPFSGMRGSERAPHFILI